MPPSPTPHASAAALRPLPEPAYELRVQPRDDIGYRIAFYRRGSVPDGTASDGEQVVRVWGDPLLAILDQVLGVIRRAGYRATDLNATRRAPFHIDEEDAVRVGSAIRCSEAPTKAPPHRRGGGDDLSHGARGGVLLVQQGDGRPGAGAGQEGASDHGFG